MYCSGIQLLNPYSINLKTKKVDDFNDVWNQLITIEEVDINSSIGRVSLEDASTGLVVPGTTLFSTKGRN